MLIYLNHGVCAFDFLKHFLRYPFWVYFLELVTLPTVSITFQKNIPGIVVLECGILSESPLGSRSPVRKDGNIKPG